MTERNCEMCGGFGEIHFIEYEDGKNRTRIVKCDCVKPKPVEDKSADNPDKVGYEDFQVNGKKVDPVIHYSNLLTSKGAEYNTVHELVRYSKLKVRQQALKEVEEKIKAFHLIIESDTAKETWIKQSEVLQAIDQLRNKGER